MPQEVPDLVTRMEALADPELSKQERAELRNLALQAYKPLSFAELGDIAIILSIDLLRTAIGHVERDVHWACGRTWGDAPKSRGFDD